MTPVVREMANVLDQAVRTGNAVSQLSSTMPLGLDDAYAVQRAGISLRRQRNDHVVGVKLGFTSRAKAEQMGVKDVIIGSLTESMLINDGGSVDLERSIHPRVEPEIAFLLSRDVDPADPTVNLLDAVGYIAPALEIIDSRYRDFKFSLEDVVADNSSASGYAIGAWLPLGQVRRDLDIGSMAVDLMFDDERVASGSSADILGNPLEALTATKRMAAQYGIPLPAGSIILAGAATAAIPLTPGRRVEASVAGLGRVSFFSRMGGDDDA